MQAVALKKVNGREAKHPQINTQIIFKSTTYNITKRYDHQWTQVWVKKMHTYHKMIEVTHYMTSDRDKYLVPE